MVTMISSTWRRLAAITLASTMGLALPASAQTLMRSPQQISQCLCQNRAVDALKAATDRQFRLYEESRQRYAALEGQVDAVRARMDVRDREQIESFQRLLDQRDAAKRDFDERATTAYAAIVDQYNASVSAYNTMCANAQFDPTVLAKVQQGLYCPR